MYTYGGNYTSWEDFSEFFSRASLKLISILEEKAQEELTEKWKPAVIHSNDGQTALVNTLRFLDEFKDKEVLKDALFWFTTHTYRNRGIFGYDEGMRILDRWGIPQEQRWRFIRDGLVDISSGGINNTCIL